MMTMVHITRLLIMLHPCMDTMDTVIIHPGIIDLMNTVIMDLDIMVTTGEEDLVIVVVMDIIGKEAGPITCLL